MEITLIIIGILLCIYIITSLFNDEAKIYIISDNYGSISAFGANDKLVAIIYKDRTIEYKGDVPFWTQVKVRNVFNHFETYIYKLKDKDIICL